MEAPITFVRTRYVYDSYGDFWKLVELSGFPTIYVDELDVSKEGIYIVSPMQGEWRPHVNNQADKPRNAHLILWNLERPSGSAGSVPQYAKECRKLMYGIWEDGRPADCRFVDEVWVSDRELAKETQLRFVPLGSDYGLGEPGERKSYQFCHMSCEIPRRTNIYKHFDIRKIGPNGWGQARHEVLMHSKFALNVHQDDHPFQEPLRFALFAAYGLPIVSETIFDSYPWSDEFMAFASYDGIVAKMRQALDDDYARWRAMGLAARERMCDEFQFGKMVRQAVKERQGDWR